MAGWDDLDKGPLGQGGGGRFLTIPEDGITVRFLDEEPYTTWVHKISQEVGGKEVFRSIMATEKLDENFIQNGSNRWPANPVFNMRCIEIQDGEPVGDIMILSGGKQIFSVLKKTYEKHGTITRFDFDIDKEGKGRDTKYSVSLAPEHADLSEAMSEIQQELESEPSLQWQNVFQVPTSDQQQKQFLDAGFDINYDPAGEIASSMDEATALGYRMPTGGGKYPGKSMKELLVIDAGYLQWVASNYTSNDTVAAAARVAIASVSGEDLDRPRKISEKPQETRKVLNPPSGPSNIPAPEEGQKKSSDRKALVQEINGHFQTNPDYEDASRVAEIIKKHSGGKTRLRDLDEAALGSLLTELSGEEAAPAKPAGRKRAGSRA